MTHGQFETERIRVMVGFGDILEFGPWSRRASTGMEEQIHLIRKLYERSFELSKQTGYYVKLIGDGFMAVIELGDKKYCPKVIDTIKTLSNLTLKMHSDIKKLPMPRPKGIRLRLVAGHVTKIKTRLCENPCNYQHDYVGYPINLASRLLEVYPSEMFICHESVFENVDRRDQDISFKKLETVTDSLSGVDHEDLEELYSFRQIKKRTNV